MISISKTILRMFLFCHYVCHLATKSKEGKFRSGSLAYFILIVIGALNLDFKLGSSIGNPP